MKRAAEEISWIAPGSPALKPEAPLRALWLSQAAAHDLPVPPAAVLQGAALATVAEDPSAAAALLTALAARSDRPASRLIALRPALPGGGAVIPTVLNLGLTSALRTDLAARLGAAAAADLERRHLEDYGALVLGLPRDAFEAAHHDALKLAGIEAEAPDPATLADIVARYRAILGTQADAVPDCAAAQLSAALSAMRARWQGDRAAAQKLARRLPADAPLAVLVQAMCLGIGPGLCGSGIVDRRSGSSGAPVPTGRYLAQAQGADALMGVRRPSVLTASERQAAGLTTPSLQEVAPEIAARILETAAAAEAALGDAVSVEFTVENGTVWLIGLAPQRRSAKAALRIAVDLAVADTISREAALVRIAPPVLDEHLHPTIAPGARAEVIARGLAASPGAASGPLVFSPAAAEAAAAAGRPAILALTETGPEDIRGMHAAAGVLTVRGGMTSHAALVARGLGKPCVVGARSLSLDRAGEQLSTRRGRAFGTGDGITVDGSEGAVIAGIVETCPPEITGAFAELMGWADATRRLAVRANADTAQDAAIARRFNASGIGLCRTEHMFFQHGRIAAMREMILAETAAARRRALAVLAPMQREDFVALFLEMAGLPVVIRLLDPPLHEFLPREPGEIAEVAERLGVSEDQVRARAAELDEFNPMLGKRGCRIGIAYPEIYEMQTEAILSAAREAGMRAGAPVRPEIMIPLVSAVREIEVLRRRIDQVAARLGIDAASYTVGVMMETPRACLRAGDIARSADFLSFGTNDLTQMLYGLSRDDAGRFMPDYVAQGVFAHDPFHRIDEEGVGEIIRLAIARAREVKPDISIGLCGEHGGEPASIDFCERARFDYVSCSPYRVPVARLAAAQARLGQAGGVA
ncbi:MAG: putative PEP-binding protein [Pikeienuella sp.]